MLGLEVIRRLGGAAAFLPAGGCHHPIGFNTWQSNGGLAPAPDMTGLYHKAILLPDRRSLAAELRQVLAAASG